MATLNVALHSAYEAVPVLLQSEMDGYASDIWLVLCGCGGNGSWLAPHLARRTWQLNRTWQQLAAQHLDNPARFRRTIHLVFVDPDVVEMKNIEARQNFSPADVGFPKAQVLAARYALAYGLTIRAIVAPFDIAEVKPTSPYGSTGGTMLIVGCVDNARARQSINAALARNVGARWPTVWWLDAGNSRAAGQIILGNTASVERLAGALQGAVCSRLPSPALVEPGLLVPKEDEDESAGVANLSCEELALADQQSPVINPHMAVWLDTYIHGLLYGGLKLCATYVSLDVGTVRSVETSAQDWARLLGKEPSFFLEPPTEAAPEDDSSEEGRTGGDEEVGAEEGEE
jgi:PRTRC genetic system ThiF family protein